jgi:hypothetical protein
MADDPESLNGSCDLQDALQRVALPGSTWLDCFEDGNTEKDALLDRLKTTKLFRLKVAGVG